MKKIDYFLKKNYILIFIIMGVFVSILLGTAIYNSLFNTKKMLKIINA